MMLMYDYSKLSNRSSRKTCVEKKRRDRINKSLDELKQLMTLTNERIQYQKLEKAEILEMTVNFIRNINQSINHSHDNYEHGYHNCLEEIWQLIYSYPHLTLIHRQYLINHCRQTWFNHRLNKQNYRNNFILNKSSTKLWRPYI